MTSFSERHGYRPDRSQVFQFEEMDDRLRNTIWNFLGEYFFTDAFERHAERIISGVWINAIGKPFDELLMFGRLETEYAREVVSNWYFKAAWHEIYDVLEYVLRNTSSKSDQHMANAILSREGAAYRFIGGVIAPITNEDELAEVEDALQRTGPFDAASQHIKQAVNHISDRGNPDVRNAIKEAISAVESAVKVASGNPQADIEKGLKKLGLHSQLEQAWKNMYNWTSDEGGVRHGKEEISQVGLPEARYMVVASSAFVNYLIAKHAEKR